MCSSVLNSINVRSPIITVFTLGKEKPKPASLGAKAGGSPNPPKQPKDSVPWSGPPTPAVLQLTSCPRSSRPLRTGGCIALFLQETEGRSEPASPLPARRLLAAQPRPAGPAQEGHTPPFYLAGLCGDFAGARKSPHIFNVPHVTGAALTFYDLSLRSIPGA